MVNVLVHVRHFFSRSFLLLSRCLRQGPLDRWRTMMTHLLETNATYNVPLSLRECLEAGSTKVVHECRIKRNGNQHALERSGGPWSEPLLPHKICSMECLAKTTKLLYYFRAMRISGNLVQRNITLGRHHGNKQKTRTLIENINKNTLTENINKKH